MPHRRLRRLIALFAVAALLLAVTVYGSHLHHPGGKPNETTHCDLCLQFGGTAGPSTATALPIRAALLVRLERSRDAAEAPSREQPRSHRSRAPPFVT